MNERFSQDGNGPDYGALFARELLSAKRDRWTFQTPLAIDN